MAQELEAFVKKVTDKFMCPDLESKQRTTLAALSDPIGQATQRGFCNGSGTAVTIATDEALPMTAFTDLGPARDAATFRRGFWRSLSP